MDKKLKIVMLEDKFSINKLPQFGEIPVIFTKGDMCFTSRTDDELTIICPFNKKLAGDVSRCSAMATSQRRLVFFPRSPNRWQMQTSLFAVSRRFPMCTFS
jgi:hypothetical protein